MADWDPFVTPINFATVDGLRTPGVCRFDSEGYRNEIENKRINGSTGQFAVQKGRNIPTFALECTIVNSADWALHRALASAVLDPLPNGKTAKAHAVVHPQVQELQIQSASYLGRKGPLEVGKGKWQVVYFFEQWARSSPVQSSINGANGNARQGREEDEKDARIRDLSGQADALAQELANG